MSFNLKELGEWADGNFKKDNATLISLGARPEKLTKIRAYLRGVIDRCKIVIKNTESNNKYIEDIKDYLQQLTKVGIVVPGTGKNESKNERT